MPEERTLKNKKYIWNHKKKNCFLALSLEEKTQ